MGERTGTVARGDENADEVEAREERPGVHVHRILEPPGARVCAGGGHVAPENIQVDPQLLGATDGALVAKIATQGGHRLRRRRAPALLVVVGPEQREHVTARPTFVTCPGEHRQPRETALLRFRVGEGVIARTRPLHSM